MAAALWRSLARRKPLPEDDKNPHRTSSPPLARVLSTWDLTALGVGSTLGVGIYVLAGDVARRQAGPAVLLSFVAAGIASGLAGLCYAEFGSRVPLAGSAYVYSYVSVGELLAFVIGWSLVLEYAIGSASVARALTSYVDQLTGNQIERTFKQWFPMNAPFMASYADPMSFLLSLGLSVILAFGVKESISLNNVFAGLNMAVIIFVVVAGSFKANPKNWSLSPGDAPKGAHVGDGGFFPFGAAGVLRGAATCFYGFVGFDCIAASGEEVRRPQRAIPIAILSSLIVVCISYLGVAAVLTLMWPYYDIADDGAPLASIFGRIGWPIAQWVVAIGGIFGLLTSLFGTMFPLPRVVYAMAVDGLIFRFLGKVHSRYQTPFIGTLLSGLLTSIMAALFHLQQLVDMLSIGTLMAYTLVAICVLLLRYRPCEDDSRPTSELSREATHSKSAFCRILKQLLNTQGQKTPTKTTSFLVTVLIVLYSLVSIGFAVCLVYGNWDIIPLGTIACVLTLLLIFLTLQPSTIKSVPFKVPLVPILPALSISMNIYLMFLLDSPTWIRFSTWMAAGCLLFLIFIACRWCFPNHKRAKKSCYTNDAFEGTLQSESVEHRNGRGKCSDMVILTSLKRTDELTNESSVGFDVTDQTANDIAIIGAVSVLQPAKDRSDSDDSVINKDTNMNSLEKTRHKNRFVRPTSVIHGELAFESVAELSSEQSGLRDGQLNSIDEANVSGAKGSEIKPKEAGKTGGKPVSRFVRPTSYQQEVISFESVPNVNSGDHSDGRSLDGDTHSLYPEVLVCSNFEAMSTAVEENPVEKNGSDGGTFKDLTTLENVDRVKSKDSPLRKQSETRKSSASLQEHSLDENELKGLHDAKDEMIPTHHDEDEDKGSFELEQSPKTEHNLKFVTLPNPRNSLNDTASMSSEDATNPSDGSKVDEILKNYCDEESKQERKQTHDNKYKASAPDLDLDKPPDIKTSIAYFESVKDLLKRPPISPQQAYGAVIVHKGLRSTETRSLSDSGDLRGRKNVTFADDLEGGKIPLPGHKADVHRTHPDRMSAPPRLKFKQNSSSGLNRLAMSTSQASLHGQQEPLVALSKQQNHLEPVSQRQRDRDVMHMQKKERLGRNSRTPQDTEGKEKPASAELYSKSERRQTPEQTPPNSNTSLPNFSISALDKKPLVSDDRGRKKNQSYPLASKNLENAMRAGHFKDQSFVEMLNGVIGQRINGSFPPGKSMTSPTSRSLEINSSFTDDVEVYTDDDDVFINNSPKIPKQDSLSRNRPRERLESGKPNGTSRIPESVPSSIRAIKNNNFENGADKDEGNGTNAGKNPDQEENWKVSGITGKLNAMMDRKIIGSLPPLKKRETREDPLGGTQSLPQRRGSTIAKLIAGSSDVDSERSEDVPSKDVIRSRLESLFISRYASMSTSRSTGSNNESFTEL